jgi:hypothetical protein
LAAAAAAVLCTSVGVATARAGSLTTTSRVRPTAAADAAAASITGSTDRSATEPGHRAAGTTGCQDRADERSCLLPFPSDWWTRPDPTSATGRRVDLPLAAMPSNVAGLPMVPTEWNRRDGFSPGETILVHVPGLDSPAALAKTGAVSVTNMGGYARPSQPIVVIDAATGRRWPVWSEVDTTAGSPAETLLMIHPSRNFLEGHRYIVALRNLRQANGGQIEAPAQFAAERDGDPPATDPRAAHTEELLGDLARAGIARRGMYLAWDFTVASASDTTGRLLSMRNRSFAQLGDTNLADGKVAGHSPPFKIVSVQDRTPQQDPYIARQVTLTVQVPCFIFPTCSPVPTTLRAPPDGLKPALALAGKVTNELPEVGFDPSGGTPDFGAGRFVLDRDGMPVQNPVPTEARVLCNIPRRAFARGAAPLRPSLYGHGLLGSAHEVDAHNVREMSQRHGMLYCATDWFGMAAGDIPNALTILADVSRFPSLVDRMQQGILNQLVVGRTLIASGGLSTAAPFRVGGRSVIDTRALFYDGNSQGGIYGGTTTAVSPDVRRAVIGVPGMTFSVLMPRSADFIAAPGQFGLATPLELAYPSPADRLAILDLLQMLWDRADPNGYAAHLTDHPLPDTPSHQVLMQVAFGDHQVANVTADTEARTAGIPVVWPALEAGRSRDRVPYWDIPHLTRFPSTGSAMVIFDSGPVRREHGEQVGVGPPPPTNVPDSAGEDPHEDPRAARCGQDQKSAFLLRDGTVTAPCAGPPYFAGTWTGR